MRHENKVAVITGAGQGLGLATAERFLREGARVVIGEENAEACAYGVAKLAAGDRVHAVQMDISDEPAVRRLIDEAVAAFGRIDFMINNAGMTIRGPLEGVTLEHWNRVVGVNLTGAFLCSKYAAPHLADAGGAIVNISSTRALMSEAHDIPYSAAKAGLLGLTRALANEWAGKGINVNAIAPGYFATDNTQALRDDPERNAAILARIPAGRWGRPDDLAGAAVFLASDAAAYVHGSVLAVDGGWLAR